ncbi:hypothetical protein SANA_31280 [Gottschalkiaceae bacterium SANA]|nr:hypothetical protein SANA_31280 [Gottschalkiaceae bacterium SANA]
MKLRRNIGFTLIEVLLVIGLLGSVTAIAAPNFFGAKDHAEEEACRDQMDYVLSGFQTEQLYPDSIFAYAELLGDGDVKLNAYIDLAINPATSTQVGFPDHLVCPSGDTQYEAWIDEERLYVHCKVHDVLSHASLGPRPLKPDLTSYDTGDGWTSGDNNWVIGDHESFFVLPLEDEYYHVEIGFRFILYDNGDGVDDGVYEYKYDDPDWYWEIPLREDVPAGSDSYYDVSVIDHVTDPDRPAGYDLSSYNPTNEDLTFSVIIDYQEKGEELAFTSNALEIKNVKSNAQLDMDLDLVKQSIFSPDDTTHADHERDLFDGVSDWMIVDVVPYSETHKLMYFHMLDKNGVFRNIFGGAVEVPVASEEMGDVQFAFFVGKRAVIKDKKLINGLYYPDAYPTPVQVNITDWRTDFEGDYEVWYTKEYEGYEEHLY